jgi:hypothetical protein
MILMPEERAAGAVAAYRRSGDLEALKAAIASHLAEVIGAERRGLRTTLGLCAEVLRQVLALAGVPHDLRVGVRVCFGLCLAGLAEESGEPSAADIDLEALAPPTLDQR